MPNVTLLISIFIIDPKLVHFSTFVKLNGVSCNVCLSSKERPKYLRKETCNHKVLLFVATLSYTVTVADVRDNTPECSPTSYYATISENAATSASVSFF